MRIFESVRALFGRGIEKKSITLTDPLAAEIFGSVPTISGPAITPATAIRVPAVYSAIALISGAIGSLPAKVFEGNDSGKRTAKDHPAYSLIHDWSNDWTSAGKLRSKLTIDALLFDHGFAYANRNGEGQVVELIRLDPQSVTPKHDETTGEPFYSLRQPSGRERIFSYRDILHVSSPLDLSPIKAGREAIGTASVLERQAAQLFAGGARPGLVFTKDGNVPNTEDGSNEIKNLRTLYQRWMEDGNRNPLTLPPKWQVSQHAMNSTDAQFLENRRFQTEDIARLFRVPPPMIFDLSRATWSNSEEMFQQFRTFTLSSWLDEWVAAYARVLLSPEERAKGYYVEFIVDDLLTANAATRATVWQQLRASGAITANEIRSQLNMPPMDGGDVLASPFTTPAPAATPAASNDNSTANKDAA